MSRRIALPAAVARIYEAVAELERSYPGRKFTPDGHLVGSIGEVIAAEALGLKLHPPSYPSHDAFDDAGDVQIKMTGQTGKSVALYATCNRLVVLKIVSPHEAELVYDGPGEPAWSAAGAMGKNGQRVVSLSRLRTLALRVRAAQHGRSTEAEIRDILENAVRPATRVKLGAELAAFGQQVGGLDLDITRDSTPADAALLE